MKENLADKLANFKFKMQVATRWSDMDEMHHVNNAVYLTYFEQARVYYFQETCQWNWSENGVILANAYLDYLRPLRFPELAYIYVRTRKMGNKSFELEYVITRIINNEEEAVAAGFTTLVMFDYKTQQSIQVPDNIRNMLLSYEKVKF